MAKREMDNLAKDAAAALAAGMSYGKWKAMQDPVKIEREPGLPTGWKRCRWCNEPFVAKPKQQYCGVYCQKTAQRERAMLKSEELCE